jgi:5,10-methylenetetrahydromethanopterin reductase
MRFSLRTNNDLSIAELTELAQVAERHGFDQLWVSNDLFLRSAPALLGFVAARTSRISLGIGIMNPYSVHPSEIAMAAATLQEVTEGRFLLGLGAGAAEFLGWAGIRRERPLAMTRASLVAIRTLIGGHRPADVPEAGSGWDQQAYLRFSSSEVPIYVGAMSPRMLALGGELADGLLPLLFPPEHYPTAVAEIHAGAAGVGREVDEIDVAACVWCSIDDDGERARRALAAKIAYFGASFSPFLLERAGLSVADFDDIQAALAAEDLERAIDLVTPQMLQLGIAGDAQDVIERCRWLVSRGATHLSFGPPLGDDILSAVEALGERVLPRFHTPD